MKSKFISGILTLMVVLGLVLVPAVGVPAVFAQAAGKVCLEMPADVKVQKGETFEFDVTITNPDETSMAVATAAVRADDQTLFTVNSLTQVDWPAELGSWIGVGEFTYDGGGSSGIPSLNATSVVHCTVNCTANATTEGTTTVRFVHDGGEYNVISCSVFDTSPTPVDILDWDCVQNMTLTVGTPKLTVNVAGSGDVSVEGTGIPASYPNTTDQNWDDVVTLTAVPDAGWGFVNWTGDLTGSTNPDDITMDALTKDVTANFAELPCDLDVDPNMVNLEARHGADEDSGTVTIANDGGGTLCWQLGTPPSWSVGDTWTYWNTYDTVPNPSPPPAFLPYPNPYYNGTVCPVNDTVLNLTVVGEDADNYYAVADWPIADPQRTASTIYGNIPCCLQDASVIVDKCTLDYVQQLANLTLYLPGQAPLVGQALVTWAYDPGCHGWPYYGGKTWYYNMSVLDATGLTVHPAQAMVTGYNSTMGAWIITHASPNMAGAVFMQQYWSDTARNFVFQWDGGTFNAPPVDVRTLTGSSIASLPPPAGCVPDSWLSVAPTAGDCDIGGSDVITVTGNTTGLAVGTYNTSFCVSGCCGSVDYEVVDVTLNVLPATSIDVIRELPADAMDFDAEYPGDSFWVNITFQASVDNFNSIGLTDYAPAGWDVETNVIWCDPEADWTMSPYNKAEYAWAGGVGDYAEGTNFTAKYKVTIPATAIPGINEWPNCTPLSCPPCEGSPVNQFAVWVEYWFANEGPYESCITGDYQKIVTVPGCVVGETRDVNGDLLDTVLVTLYEDDDVWEDNDSSSIVGNTTAYENCADDTGYYYQIAQKYCYDAVNSRPVGDGGSIPGLRNPNYPDYIDWSTPELLAAGAIMDFVGDYGLVCKGASMSYAMESVNHMLFTPLDDWGVARPDWQLSNWKAMQSVANWQFPCGCGCG